ncbi:polymorphic toxin type 50 domain-containing protein [Myxococcus faecalis]|uniref:polymorphic toxin type 50 domain-containing protein n=1 Tax=Myxococcus faecalis TaxID=3115646 RepID=UPI003CFAD3A9
MSLPPLSTRRPPTPVTSREEAPREAPRTEPAAPASAPRAQPPAEFRGVSSFDPAPAGERRQVAQAVTGAAPGAPAEAPRASWAQRVGNWAADTARGYATGAANLVLDSASLVNAGVNRGLGAAGIDFRFRTDLAIQPRSQAEAAAQNAVSLSSMLLGGVGAARAAAGAIAPRVGGAAAAAGVEGVAAPAAARVLLEEAKQGKHIVGHQNYIPGRSPFTHPNPQGLLDRFSGQGQPVGNVARGQPGFRERVDFGEVIGQVNGQPTTRGIIHYSSQGAHIVPANP